MASLERILELMGLKSQKRWDLGATFPHLSWVPKLTPSRFVPQEVLLGHEILLEGMEDPLTQQRKFRTTKHYALDQFDFRDLALDLSILYSIAVL